MENKKRLLITVIVSIILVIIFSAFYLINFNIPNNNTNENNYIQENSNQEYLELLSKIEKGNNYILSNGTSDSCFPYRYFHRGCYYEGKQKFYNGLLVSSFLSSNLSHDERIELCYKFIFNGSTAYCLQQNNEIEKCLEFAGQDTYLKRICDLKEGETIPTEGIWDPKYKDDPIPTVYINKEEEISSELSKEDIPEEDPERSNYYNIINNIDFYLGAELTFENVEITSRDWGGLEPYHIMIVEDDGTAIFLPLLEHESLTWMQTHRNWTIKGVVKSGSGRYYLSVSHVEII
ncbi:hypothetical protein GF386_01375 [Candidatus Pacearchaeota archaeon]|nr:hypothetical protein [Candidatus Pacearchaeota archaeon]